MQVDDPPLFPEVVFCCENLQETILSLDDKHHGDQKVYPYTHEVHFLLRHKYLQTFRSSESKPSSRDYELHLWSVSWPPPKARREDGELSTFWFLQAPNLDAEK